MNQRKDRKPDRRTRYTRMAIKDALLSILAEKEYADITVADLCRTAEINRGTFYLHYDHIRQVLDELFWADSRTVRYGATENLYGIEAIRAFRNARPSAGLDRLLRNTTITTYGEDMAVASTEFTRENSERIGRQMQTWVKFPFGWRIVAAHVSVMQ